MTLLSFRNHFQKELQGVYPSKEVLSLFYWVVEYYTKITRFGFSSNPDLLISPEKVIQMKSALKRLKENQPIQYILGEIDFRHLKLSLNPNVLIPRPETEELIDWIVRDKAELEKLNKEIEILDVGTGSGCIAISLAKEIKNSRVVAFDVSSLALETAKNNAVNNQTRLKFIELDILSKKSIDASFNDNQFDVIVSNPPYVRLQERKLMNSNVLDHEPHIALFVSDEDPLVFYRAIAELAVYKLKNGGELYFEINEYLGEEMKTLLKDKGFVNIELRNDIFGKPRMIKAKHR